MIMLYQCIIMLCVYTIYCYTAGCMHAMIVIVIYFSGIQSDCLTGEKRIILQQILLNVSACYSYRLMLV